MNRLIFSLLLFVFAPFSIFSQVEIGVLSENINETVGFLASDEVKGREAGTKYEYMARDYIVNEFEEIGLEPYLEEGFNHEFSFMAAADFSKSTLKIGNVSFKTDKEFYPLNKSGENSLNAKIIDINTGIEAKEINDYDGVTDIESNIALIDLKIPDEFKDKTKHGVIDLDTRVQLAIKKGAKAVILINSGENSDPRKAISDRSGRYDVPVIFVRDFKKIKKLAANNPDAELKVEIKFKSKKSYNVIGFLNNDKEKTIVLGAHYDHLGMGGPTSRFLEGPQIHNGADDNASGVAAIIEIARYFAQNNEARENLNFNLAFIAFAAEEKGLYGSSAIVNDSIFDFEELHSMLNFDMVGRLKDDLTLIGAGTAKEWKDLIKSTENESFKVKPVNSSSGGSDHIHFYNNGIPVLFFFTGIHEDYHRPEDDLKRLNIEGEAMIINYTIRLIKNFNEYEELTYVKQNIAEKGKRAKKYKVTLGIMPDYAGNSKGLKVTSVMDGGAASKAGFQDGDIIIKMGEIEVGDIYDYMNALSSFKKGQTTTVIIMRNGEKLKKEVTF